MLQRYHLIRLLQVPPDGTGLRASGSLGRYVCAGRFVAAAHELGLETYQLGYLLNQRHARTRGYWLVRTTSSQEAGSEDFWPQMLATERVGLGYPKVRDLTEMLNVGKVTDLKAALRDEVVGSMYPNDANARQTEKAACTFDANMLLRLGRSMKDGDIVLARRGTMIRGIGRITGDYEYVPGSSFPHARSVEWLHVDDWQLPEGRRFPGQVINDLSGEPEILVEAERRLFGVRGDGAEQVLGGAGKTALDRQPPLPPVAARIEAILRRKGQLILYGPPGTGKTHWALIAARELVDRI